MNRAHNIGNYVTMKINSKFNVSNYICILIHVGVCIPSIIILHVTLFVTSYVRIYICSYSSDLQ